MLFILYIQLYWLINYNNNNNNNKMNEEEFTIIINYLLFNFINSI